MKPGLDSSSEFREVNTRVVSPELQERFAELCGDRNPMHMDAVAARRTQAGRPVVHGVHSLLWALESMVESGRLVHPPTRITVKFLRWICVGDRAVLATPSSIGANPRVFQVNVNGGLALTAELDYAEPPSSVSPLKPMLPPLPRLSVPRERCFEALNALSGDTFLASTDDTCALFSHLSAIVGAGTVSELAACSYIVGMEAPGLHSTFSKMDLHLARPRSSNEEGKSLHFEVLTQDPRFRKARIAVSGDSIAGTLDVFVRPPPVVQPSMVEVVERVQEDEFISMRALVIGGSRGLGELVAKMIAAGGGKSTITYAVGKHDAEAVVEQIRNAGGKAESFHYDARNPPEPQLEALRTAPTHLFYFATSAIFRPKGRLFSYPAFEEFSKLYLQGFYDLCMALTHSANHAPAACKHLAVFYPSSTFVEERPSGMTEYAMIKSAGEQLCKDMNEHDANLRILVARLPRLATDQTATIVPGRELNAIDVLLPFVRQTQRLGLL